MSLRGSDDIFENLKELLLSVRADRHGRMRLPPERELAEQLGAQRSTIRERLNTLEALGLIERLRGSGTYLRLPKPGFVQMYFDLALRLGYVAIDEMEEAREMLERQIVRIAALRASNEDIDVLQELCDRMIAASSIDDGLEADYEFHRRLANSTQNPVIILLIEGLSSVLREVVHRRRVMVRQVPEGAERTNRTHIAIVEALRQRDPAAAEQAMDNHFEVWNRESARIGSGSVPAIG